MGQVGATAWGALLSEMMALVWTRMYFSLFPHKAPVSASSTEQELNVNMQAVSSPQAFLCYMNCLVLSTSHSKFSNSLGIITEIFNTVLNLFVV